MTEFRDIPGYGGAYAISRDGRVLSRERRVSRLSRTGLQQTKRVPEKLLKPLGPFKNRVNLYRDAVMECIGIEHLVLVTYGDRR